MEVGRQPRGRQRANRPPPSRCPGSIKWDTSQKAMQVSETVMVGLISAASGLAGVIVATALPWFRDRWNNKRQARYLAIRVVCVLDEFVDQCTCVVADDGLCDGQRNAQGCLEPQIAQPKGLPLPTDVDWRSIDYDLMYNILTLPSRIEGENRAISFAAENSFPPDYNEVFEERRHRYSCLGLDAAALTNVLRTRYGIPAQEFGDWDPIGYLTDEKIKIDKIREDRKSRSSISII